MAKRLAGGLRAPTKKRVLGMRTFAAMSAVEGLRLSHAGKKRIAAMARSKLSPKEQRLKIVEAYRERKKSR